MWHVLTKDYQVVGNINSGTPKGCPLLRDNCNEELTDGYTTLDFDVPSNHPTAKELTKGAFVVYTDETQGYGYELFRVIKTTEATGLENVLTVQCETAATEDLRGTIIDPYAATGRTLAVILQYLLQNTGWELGECYYDELVDYSTNDYPTALEAIRKLIQDYGAEIEFKVEFKGLKVKRKVVNIYRKRGNQNTGITLEYRRNLKGLKKIITRNSITTSMVAIATQKDANGNDISIMDAEKALPDGYVKTNNRIIDLAATAEHGSNGKAIEDKFTDQVATNPVALQDNTLAALQKANKPQESWEADAEFMEGVEGYSHLTSRIGDRIIIQDFSGDEPKYVSARILKKSKSVKDRTQGELSLGEYEVIKVRDSELVRAARDKLALKEQQWDQATEDAKQAQEQAVRSKEEAIAYANGIQELLTKDINSIDQQLDNFSDFVKGSFTDSLIDKAEARTFSTYIQDLTNTKSALDARYNKIFTHELLPSEEKTTLSTIKNEFNIKNQALITVINDSIADGVATEEERTKIDASFSAYRTALNNVSGAIEHAVQVINEQRALDAEEVAKQYTNEKLTDYVDFALYKQDIEEIQKQIDGSITNWFYEHNPTLDNVPANEWTTDEIKNVHLGDIFYNTTNGYAFRFTLTNGVYEWSRIQDTDITAALDKASKAQDTADNKRRVFVVQPKPPYDIGDLYFNSNKDMLRCLNPKAAGQVYAASDWTIATRYTDDTKANEAKNAADDAQQAAEDAKQAADNAQQTADNKVDNTVYQEKVAALMEDIGKKAGLEYVNGQLISKANKDDVYTKVEVNNALDSKVSVISYKTDQEGVVERFESNESRINQTEQGLLSKVEQKTFDNAQEAANEKYQQYESTFEQQAKQIQAKVEKVDFTGENLITLLNLAPEGSKLQSRLIELIGYVTIKNLGTPGEVSIDGGNIKIGSQIILGGTENGKLVLLDENGDQVVVLDALQKGFDKLDVGEFFSPTVLPFSDKDLTYYVSNVKQDYAGAVEPDDTAIGDGWARPLRTVAEALRRIAKNNAGDAVIRLPFNGDFSEDILIEGYSGPGSITIIGGDANYQSKLSGSIKVKDTSLAVRVEYLNIFAGTNVSMRDAVIEAERASDLVVSRCKIQGWSNTPYAVASRKSNVEVEYCQFQSVDRGVAAFKGGTIINRENKGLVRYSGAYTDSGFVFLEGTMARGENFAAGGTDNINGGQIFGTKTGDAGTGSVATPPVQAKDITKTWWSTLGVAWRPNFGGSWISQPAQGKWDQWGVYKAIWCFPPDLSSTVTGKTIKKMRFYPKRDKGGNAGEVTLYFRTHNYTSQPSGEPTLSSIWYAVTFRIDEEKPITLPDSFCRAFENGAKGIGLYYGSENSAYYAKMFSNAKLEITYQ